MPTMDLKCPKCGVVPTGPILLPSGTMLKCTRCFQSSYFDTWRMEAISALNSQLQVMERQYSSKLEEAIATIKNMHAALEEINEEWFQEYGTYRDRTTAATIAAERSFPELRKEQ